jgi:DNA-binding transcriptional ArsR family regulator
LHQSYTRDYARRQSAVDESRGHENQNLGEGTSDTYRSKGMDGLRILRKYLRKMRTSPVLDALFPAVRQRLLAATLLQPDRWWYLTELAAHLGTAPSSLQRELESLTRSGLLERKQAGRRTYHKANTGSPAFKDLEGLFAKTAGLVPTLQAELEPFGHRCAAPRCFVGTGLVQGRISW